MDVRAELLSREQLHQYLESILANAEGLLVDACILLMHGRFARAHSLAVLGTEELAKSVVAMLFDSQFRDKLAASDDLVKAFNRGIKDHQFKFSLVSAAHPVVSETLRDWQKPQSAEIDVDYIQAHFAKAKTADTLKQDGFYVSFDGTRFHGPDDVINRDQAIEAATLLHHSLGLFRIVSSVRAGNVEDSVRAISEHSDRLHAKLKALQERIIPAT